MSRPHEIALAIRLGVPHLERVAKGIREFARAHTDWRFFMNPETHDLSPLALEGWRGEGVIAMCNTREEEGVLKSLGCPVVNISGALEKTIFPRVRPDYREIGRRAAAYLWKRGFRRLGYYGVEGVWYSREIESGYREFGEAQGVAIASLRSASTIGETPRWDQGQEELDAWLLEFEKPFAILAAHDPRATMVIRACDRNGLAVPREVGVIGVNDDTSTCEASRPTLTSIERNGEALGWKVAEFLDEMIAQQLLNPAREIVIPPGEVRVRESTQTFAIDHPALREAVAFVEAHHAQPISVDQIAAAAGKSRRWIEDRFRAELQCSPSEFLRLVRVETATDLLSADQKLGIGELADRCGFSGTRQINAAFRAVAGMSVREFALERG